MKKLIFLCCGTFLGISTIAQTTETYQVAQSDVFGGYVVKKIWLKHYEMPSVRISANTAPATLPDAKTPVSSPSDIKITLGKERKRPFALVSVPVYSTSSGQTYKVTSFSLNVNETADNTATTKPQAKATIENSPLAAGNWHKIALTQRGLYKLDYNYFKNTLNLDPAGFSSNDIRIYGNGGTMLPENNAVAHNTNLTENAIWVNDGGDGKLDQGDYVVFYANGPMAWNQDPSNKGFTHSKNLYSDSSFYFISVDQGAGKRITAENGTQASNVAVSSFDDYMVHDTDLVNPGKFGKEWWGESFNPTTSQSAIQNFTFNTGNITDSVRVRLYVGSASPYSGNSFTFSINGQAIETYPLGAALGGDQGDPLTVRYAVYGVPAASAYTFTLNYQSPSPDGRGYLDYIELNLRRPLSFASGQMNFRDWRSVGTGNTAGFQLQNANSNLQVWDVTDQLNPVKINGALSGSTYSFSRDAQSLHEYIASDGSQYLTPVYKGTVDNQNLHGNGQVDYIIVTHPDFINAANKLADFHRQHDNMRVVVATTAQIYNEFSSGSQDISAIRDYAKMFYDRAGNDTTQMPRYMLLFGDASYDYKDRVADNTNYVPTFESAESVSMDSGFSNDDFFTFLDDNEYIENSGIANTMDLGLGRIPVGSRYEADTVVAKIIHYKDSVTLGPWRLTNTYIADNEDNAGAHLSQAEDMCKAVDTLTSIYNDNKIYLDNLNFVSTPGGDRCPDANKAINDQIYKGTFLLNYNGHGSIYTLAHERILTADDFNTWKNIDKLPFMVTATCDFSRFDDPSYVSAGEKLILKSDGGAIALLTTTQLTYAYANYFLNKQFLQAQFAHANGSWNTFGDAFRTGKNQTYLSIPAPGTLINFRKFTLLGDPALEPDFPEYFVSTDTVKTLGDGIVTDTISALGGYKISGKVNDLNGQILSNFNGRLYVTIYDKARTINLLTKVYDTPRTYKMQDNIIYKGKATVTNGHFSFSFVAPKDLNYDYGNARISYYAENGVTDAAGIDTGIVVGGYSDNPVVDNDGPVVQPYMNDSLFIDGGITGSNTVLFAKLFDETGINISGNSVGHDLTAVLDGDVQNPYILNDYYETADNDYKHGYVHFPVSGLSNGAHTFRVKAWDVNNNSGEGEVHFVVVDGNIVAIGNLMNYPNPFKDNTHFVFEHNHPDEQLDVTIRIFNTSGALARTLKQSFTPSGSRSSELIWDGTDESGAKLPSGVYIYRINISTAKGIQQSAYQKLVLIR
ncbi:type IX secretion system sortase PorU [Chitinophagaceae bacterium MMS25-I14]